MKRSAPTLISPSIRDFALSCTGLLRVWSDDKIYMVYILVKESYVLHLDPGRLPRSYHVPWFIPHAKGQEAADATNPWIGVGSSAS